MNLKNKTVLITGGAKGIGLATAKRILEQGSMVILWDFDRESLDETTKNFHNNGFEVFSQVCDVTNKEQIYFFADHIFLEIVDFLLVSFRLLEIHLHVLQDKKSYIFLLISGC